jgi:uncharacterized membrane protein YidH (DUF202 family)
MSGNAVVNGQHPEQGDTNGHSSEREQQQGDTTSSAQRHGCLPKIPSFLDPSLVLENSGSVARDHLASERTFLAYLRTSLAIASMGVGMYHFYSACSEFITNSFGNIGIALVQLFTIATESKSSLSGTSFSPTSRRVQGYAKPLGATTIVFGLCVLAIGRSFNADHSKLRFDMIT